ncbi:hypothetical protein ACFT0G_35800 [Streptomyces sp. NPDC057020]|uniref:hypothetical protein n=1 Tax=unclassified Streptomyces TaxID=2593676 RepID=UPI003640AA25
MTLPGQRSAQRPLQVMKASQRVLGRSVQAAAGGLVGAVGVAWIDGQQHDVDLLAPPGEQSRPVGAARPADQECMCTVLCPGDCAEADDNSNDEGTA